jgi:hypothetical protein
MNRLIIIMMTVLIFGLATSTASAECALHSKNPNLGYNELSAAEFFYGIPIDHVNATTVAVNSRFLITPEDATLVTGGLTASESFYGYAIPNRLETVNNCCAKTERYNIAERPGVLEISDPAVFFGFTDIPACSNC